MSLKGSEIMILLTTTIAFVLAFPIEVLQRSLPTNTQLRQATKSACPIVNAYDIRTFRATCCADCDHEKVRAYILQLFSIALVSFWAAELLSIWIAQGLNNVCSFLSFDRLPRHRTAS